MMADLEELAWRRRLAAFHDDKYREIELLDDDDREAWGIDFLRNWLDASEDTIDGWRRGARHFGVTVGDLVVATTREIDQSLEESRILGRNVATPWLAKILEEAKRYQEEQRRLGDVD
jgi:hypothetical protein